VKFYDGAKLLGEDSDVIMAEEGDLCTTFAALKRRLNQEAYDSYHWGANEEPKAVITKLKRI
jgi:hypothetical protein